MKNNKSVNGGPIHTYGNRGVLTGRLVRDPDIYLCRDGSRNYVMKLQKLYHQGASEDLPVEGPVKVEHFCPAWEENDPQWGELRKGSLVTVSYAVRTNSYYKDGEPKVRRLLESLDLRLHRESVGCRRRPSGHRHDWQPHQTVRSDTRTAAM